MSENSQQQQVWTVLAILKWTSGYFERHDVDSPRLTAELMLSHVLGVERMKLYMDFERLLSAQELSSFKSMIERRVKDREPLQYILGTTNFYGCNLFVDERVLIPRPETEILVEKAIEYIRSHEVKRVLDIGTGSGCIAIALAKHCPDVHITALDVSPAALVCARRNATLNGATTIDFIHADILKGWVGDSRYDLVVSNPPYIHRDDFQELDPELRLHEPRIALTDEADGLVFYRRFADLFPLVITDNGAFFVELSYNAWPAVRELFTPFNPCVYNDFEGTERIAHGIVSSS